MVVPYGAGGTTDSTGRLFAEHLSTALGQRVVVENRPGVQGNAGSETVTKAAPDGYTLLLSSSALSINPAIGPKPRFDVAKAFQPVVLLTTAPNVIVARPMLGAKTMPDIVKLAKDRPNAITIGAAQIDTYVELLKRRAGAELRLVPYRTSPQALTDALAGHIDLVMAVVPTALPLLSEGDKSLTALAVSSRKRSSVLPAVPTYAEAGIADAEIESWFGVHVPSGTPEAIIDRLADEGRAFLRSPATASRLATLGLDLVDQGTPETFAAYVTAESNRWLAIAKELNVKAE
ncbi:Bug family tripartite tricarboxylate transporter substrate binding protein [uncultured Enterovirga sp.]|uniref:Bug family tripartite tricarboxylate transporter substrate binding protein n=1 Tax=uncultured Enterovirga sp. TaxID=2026352 RepID=UPI0035CBA98C